MLLGMAGSGKTVHAAEAARDPDMAAAFPGGIAWIAVGQSYAGTAMLQSAALQFGIDLGGAADANAMAVALRSSLPRERCLFVLDDIWSVDPVEVFRNLGAPHHLVCTARDQAMATSLGAKLVAVEQMPPAEARALLAAWWGRKVSALPPEADTLVEECGRLPLALSMAGAKLHDGATCADILDAMRASDLEFMGANLPQVPYRNLFQMLDASVRWLPEAMRTRYVELAVFAEDVQLPEAAVLRYWQHTGSLKRYQAAEALTRLHNLSLLGIGGEGDARTVSLHDLQQDYVVNRAADRLPALHAALLDSWRKAAPDGWHTLPADGYSERRLAWHLRGARRTDELRALLLDARWIRRRVDDGALVELLDDYGLMGDDAEVDVVERALRLSSQIMARQPAQLASQLHLRLQGLGEKAVAELLRALAAAETGPWLRPTTRSLTAPGPLLRVLEGHTNWVNAVAFAPDGKRALSGSDDNTLRLWDLQAGQSRVLEGHTSYVLSVAFAPDGKRALSGSYDNTLRL